MQQTRLYLVRHGQVEGFAVKRYNGQSNIPLTELGLQQSGQTSRFLQDYSLDAVYSSDLDRSLYCAKMIAESHAVDVTADKNLRELHIGHWQGRTWSELKESNPEDWEARLQDLANFRVPGGESLQDAADRIRPVLQDALEKYQGGTIALVAHGGVNRIVLLDAIGADLSCAFSIEQDFGCINIIDYLCMGRSVVRLLNSTAHQLPDSGLTNLVTHG